MVQTDLITIIIPVYNAEKYLHTCIDSVLKQTYKNLEILLIDDGSTDSGGNICDEYAQLDTRVRVVHKTNGGPSSARNIGLLNAIGDFISFIDADDYVDNDYIEKLKEKIENFDIAIINSNYEYKTFNKYQAMFYLVSSLNNAPWGKLYRRSIIGDIKFEEGKTHGEDYDFLSRLIPNVTNIVLFKNFSYHYEERPNSITHSKFSPKTFDNIYYKDKVKNFILSLDKGYSESLIYAERNCFMGRINVMFSINQSKTKEYFEQYNECYSYIKENYPNLNKILNYKQKIRYYYLILKGKK